MSVRTTFDEKREAAKDGLGIAIVSIQECLKEDTWGYNDIRTDYIDELAQMLADLIKMKRKL